MHTVAIKLKTQQAKALRTAYRKADTDSALRAALDEAIERARLKAEYPRPHAPSPSTLRALRGKGDGRVFKSKADFAKWLKAVPSR